MSISDEELKRDYAEREAKAYWRLHDLMWGWALYNDGSNDKFTALLALHRALGEPQRPPPHDYREHPEAQRHDGVVPMLPPRNDAWRHMMRGTLWGVGTGIVALLGLLIAMLVTQ